MRELSAGGIARMRNQIHFRETRSSDVPAVGLHRNVVLEQIARLGAPVNPPSPLRLLRFQPAVHLPRTDLQQLLFDLWSHAKTLADPRQPLRQQRLQPHRPGIASGFPHRRQHRHGFLVVTQPTPPHWPSPPLLRRRSAEQADGVLPMVLSVLAKFVQDHLLDLSSRLPITLINRPQILPSPLVPQPIPPHSPFWLGYILNGATLSPS